MLMKTCVLGVQVTGTPDLTIMSSVRYLPDWIVNAPNAHTLQWLRPRAQSLVEIIPERVMTDLKHYNESGAAVRVSSFAGNDADSNLGAASGTLTDNDKQYNRSLAQLAGHMSPARALAVNSKSKSKYAVDMRHYITNPIDDRGMNVLVVSPGGGVEYLEDAPPTTAATASDAQRSGLDSVVEDATPRDRNNRRLGTPEASPELGTASKSRSRRRKASTVDLSRYTEGQDLLAGGLDSSAMPSYVKYVPEVGGTAQPAPQRRKYRRRRSNTSTVASAAEVSMYDAGPGITRMAGDRLPPHVAGYEPEGFASKAKPALTGAAVRDMRDPIELVTYGGGSFGQRARLESDAGMSVMDAIAKSPSRQHLQAFAAPRPPGATTPYALTGPRRSLIGNIVTDGRRAKPPPRSPPAELRPEAGLLLCCDRFGSHPLMRAVTHNDPPMVSQLLSYLTTVACDMEVRNGTTPLTEACRRGLVSYWTRFAGVHGS